MGAEHEPMNRIPGGKDLVLEGDWPIVLHKVALKAPKLPSKERVYTEIKNRHSESVPLCSVCVA